MIQIQEHLNKPNTKAFLKQLTSDHWDYLNPKKRDGSYYAKSLVSLCCEYTAKSSTKAYQKKYAKNVASAAKRHTRFFKYLIANNEAKLKQIIASAPTGLSRLKNEILNILNESDLCTLENGKLKQTEFGLLLSGEIFNYKKFRDSDFCLELFRKLEVSSASCPYCNDNKISIVRITKGLTSKERLKAYFEVDHFLSKVENPFFAVSFFNLIPACHSCNSSDKSDKSFTLTKHIHPYLKSFDDYFVFELNRPMSGKPGDKIKISSLVGGKYKYFIQDLNLEERYQSNLDQINDLAELYFKYQHYVGTSSQTFFVDMILNQVPKQRFGIMRKNQGKMNRDILRHVDSKHGVLGL